jgi:hypothetical protein
MNNNISEIVVQVDISLESFEYFENVYKSESVCAFIYLVYYLFFIPFIFCICNI